MSIKAHRRKKASFKAFSFATYKGWSVFVAKGAAVRLGPSRWNKMAKTGLGLPRGGTSSINHLCHWTPVVACSSRPRGSADEYLRSKYPDHVLPDRIQ